MKKVSHTLQKLLPPFYWRTLKRNRFHIGSSFSALRSVKAEMQSRLCLISCFHTPTEELLPRAIWYHHPNCSTKLVLRGAFPHFAFFRVITEKARRKCKIKSPLNGKRMNVPSIEGAVKNAIKALKGCGGNFRESFPHKKATKSPVYCILFTAKKASTSSAVGMEAAAPWRLTAIAETAEA